MQCQFRGLLSVHSRYGPHTRDATNSWHAYPKASDISSPSCLLRLLPAGAVAGRGLHPLESAALSRRTPFSDTQSAPLAAPKLAFGYWSKVVFEVPWGREMGASKNYRYQPVTGPVVRCRNAQRLRSACAWIGVPHTESGGAFRACNLGGRLACVNQQP